MTAAGGLPQDKVALQSDSVTGFPTTASVVPTTTIILIGPATMLAQTAIGALAGCGDGGMAQSGDPGVAKMGEPASGAAFGHVRGLGISPRDGALFIATQGGKRDWDTCVVERKHPLLNGCTGQAYFDQPGHRFIG